MSIDEASIGRAAGLATLCEHTVVDVKTVMKIDNDVSLQIAVLLGLGCRDRPGLAVNSAKTRPIRSSRPGRLLRLAGECRLRRVARVG